MSILADLVPPKFRRYMYGLLALISLVWGAYNAAGGDWRATALAVLTALTTAMAHANTSVEVPADEAPSERGL
jgi:hypothetical protein